MAAIAQTISIVDRSGKVVSTTKQLKNVFKEAKSAYMERKADIVAERKAKEDRELRKAVRAMTIEEESTSSISRSHTHRHRSSSYREDGARPHGERRHSSRSIGNGAPESRRSSASQSPSHSAPHTPLGQFNEELYGTTSRSPPHNELTRRRTDGYTGPRDLDRPDMQRTHSLNQLDADIDMNLAYGEYHPELYQLDRANEQQLQKQELSSLVTKCKMLLDEANCAQHSIKTVVAHLQKNPDAMAAVALTLAEISNLAAKMAPGTLAAFKGSAPAVFALLASPQFLIAAGVGVGLTIVMFGGYKIVKRIRENSEENGVDEMLEVPELDRIEQWRRGIADDDNASIATSVEGEFITPLAAASMGHLPQTATQTQPQTKTQTRPQTTSRSVSSEHKDGERRRKKKHHHSTDERSDAGSHKSSESRRSSDSKKSSSGSKRPSGSAEGSKETSNKALIKVKKPSPLRRMFTVSEKSSVRS